MQFSVLLVDPEQAAPPLEAGTATDLEPVLEPEPQGRVQEVQDQADHWQSTGVGQAWVLQASDLEASWVQAAPPLAALVTMVRVADRDPVPQFALQELQALQVLQTQLTGQAWVLQASDLVVSPVQAAPPLAAWVAMEREADRVPGPQLAEQALHAPHSRQAQLTGGLLGVGLLGVKGMLGVTAVVVVMQRPQLFMQLGAAM